MDEQRDALQNCPYVQLYFGVDRIIYMDIVSDGAKFERILSKILHDVLSSSYIFCYK